jgi:hypothetical protein
MKAFDRNPPDVSFDCGLRRLSRECAAAAALIILLIPAATAADSSAPQRPIVETANFRILGLTPQLSSQTIARKCEEIRDKLVLRWQGHEASETWNPKCDIVLHSTDDSYLREVGQGGRSTVASTATQRDRGRITRRRVDVLVTHSQWPTTALGHELTHLVLADLFQERKLPRWLDEGIAILADSTAKQSQHRLDINRAVETGAEFRLVELVSLPDYPPAHRWGTFYGQSASLVQYLIDQGGEERFAEFVRIATTDGCDQGLQQTYRWRIPELERRWRAQLRQQAVPFALRKSTPARPASHVTMVAPLGTLPYARPVSLEAPTSTRAKSVESARGQPD